jgi:competence protein ComEC
MWLGRGVDAVSWAWLIPGTLGLFVAWRWAFPRPGLRRALLLTMVALLGMVRLGWWRQALPGTLSPGQTTIQGRVVAVEAGRFSTRLAVEVAPPRRGRVRVGISGPQRHQLTPGDVVTVSGELAPLGGATNPGQSDPRLRWHAAGVYWELDGQLLSVRDEPETWDRVRSLLGRSLEGSFSPEDAGLLRALLFGDTSRLAPQLMEQASASGISHLFSVSGLHASVVGLAGTYVAAKAGLGRAAPLCGLGTVVLYAGLCRMGPAVIRAAIMYGLGVAAHLARRRLHSLASLSTAGLVVLWLWPSWLYTAGFQLSFAAVAGMVLIAPILQSRLTRLPRVIGASLATSTAVQLATIPILGWHFGRLAPVGILVNLVAVPAAMAALVGGVITAVMGLFSNPLGRILGVPVSAALRVLEYSAVLGSGLPGASVAIPAFGLFGAAAYYLLLASCLDRPSRRRRALVLAACTILVWSIAVPGASGLEVVIFDIGQGDAILLRVVGGPVVLVDSGPPGLAASPAAFTIVPYLRRAGVRGIDVLLITHAHDDHYGGALDVLRAFPCRYLVVATPHAGWPRPELVDAVSRTGGEVRVVHAGEQLQVGAIGLKILHPPPGFLDEPNNSSLVVRASYGHWSMLLTGDIYAGIERQLLASHRPYLVADLLKVAHHGSLTSSSPEFLAAVGARHAVISSGGKFGHPSPVVMDRLAAAGMRVWRTDLHGAILVTVTARGWTIRGFVGDVGEAKPIVEALVA